ncbi:uncharacterized protein PSFLO_03002 [Pseudozyma flocculosa]|uniref:Uncharacterized protein n=1 Tax=Pseudozyma flocculosa TaxID=84751 RepID=A0A5C3F1D4_9BASI|nr:uncharacterized protein PSFLO_03002 [Pseudozyma flocculosa]
MAVQPPGSRRRASTDGGQQLSAWLRLSATPLAKAGEVGGWARAHTLSLPLSRPKTPPICLSSIIHQRAALVAPFSPGPRRLAISSSPSSPATTSALSSSVSRLGPYPTLVTSSPYPTASKAHARTHARSEPRLLSPSHDHTHRHLPLPTLARSHQSTPPLPERDRDRDRFESPIAPRCQGC